MKYIRFKKVENCRDSFVIFPRDVQHRHMREVIGQGDINVLSAGFVRITPDGKLECYGESIGLRKKPMPDDTDKINEYFYEQARF